MRLLPASYVASVRGAAHAAVRKAMLTPDALYYASDIKPAAYCNENPGGPCIVVCTNQRNATLCASRQPAVQHLNNPENLSKRARPPLAAGCAVPSTAFEVACAAVTSAVLPSSCWPGQA